MSKRGGGKIHVLNSPAGCCDNTHTGNNAESNNESTELETERGEQGCTHLSNVTSLICDEDSDLSEGWDQDTVPVTELQ